MQAAQLDGQRAESVVAQIKIGQLTELADAGGYPIGFVVTAIQHRQLLQLPEFLRQFTELITGDIQYLQVAMPKNLRRELAEAIAVQADFL
ncbi:hypothetical protein D3C79_853640 [compost metagenome]